MEELAKAGELTMGAIESIVTGGGKLTEGEARQMLALCRLRGINPLAKDAYITKFDGSPAAVIVSKDYYLRTAANHPTFAGLKAGVVVASKASNGLVYREGSIVGAATEQLVGGWAEVYDTRWQVPWRAEVSMAEYDGKRALWKTKPATMIRKVALVQALREAYPESYAGLYDESEMPRESAAIEATIIKEDTDAQD